MGGKRDGIRYRACRPTMTFLSFIIYLSRLRGKGEGWGTERVKEEGGKE